MIRVLMVAAVFFGFVAGCAPRASFNDFGGRWIGKDTSGEIHLTLAGDGRCELHSSSGGPDGHVMPCTFSIDDAVLTVRVPEQPPMRMQLENSRSVLLVSVEGAPTRAFARVKS